jgi:hypothetical protein
MPSLSRRLEQIERRVAFIPGIDPAEREAIRERLVSQLQATYAGMTDEQREAGANAFARRFGTRQRYIVELKQVLNGGDNFRTDRGWLPPHLSMKHCWVAFVAREFGRDSIGDEFRDHSSRKQASEQES